MRRFQYIIGVDASDKRTAIAEATHRLSLAENSLAESDDYDGEFPILNDITEVQIADERDSGGPHFAVVITVNALRKIPLQRIAGGEVARRPKIHGEIDISERGTIGEDEVIDTPWCPCQEEHFEARYPNYPQKDMPFVDEIGYLQKVHTEEYYERKRKENRQSQDRQGMSRMSVGPSAPVTRLGTNIIDSNFPDVDYVCPYCEQGFVEENTIRKA